MLNIMNKKTPEPAPNLQTEKSILNFELGKIKAKANNFWIAIAFLIAFTICFITFCICHSVVKITDQYFDNLTKIQSVISSYK